MIISNSTLSYLLFLYICSSIQKMIFLYKILKRFAPWLLAFWVTLILVFSSLPKLPRINIDLVYIRIDHALHFTEYFGLAFLAILTFVKSHDREGKKRILYLILYLILFASADEAHQLLIPGRSFSLLDLLANTCGILTGVFITLWLDRKAFKV